jgi:hypothetical protein
VREWVERPPTTQPTLTRRCAPASPCQGEASLCCFVGNRPQRSVRSLDRPAPYRRQCRGDPVGRPAGGGPAQAHRVAWAVVHDGTRATHRVAPTCRACSRVRCTKEHRGRPVAWVVGAVREPPLHRPAGPWCERGDRRPCAGDRFQGTAAPCLYREWLHNGYKTAAGPLVVSGKPLKNQGRV